MKVTAMHRLIALLLILLLLPCALFAEETTTSAPLPTATPTLTEQLDKYVSQAVEALSVLPLSRERELLEELAYFTAKRVM